MPLQGYDYCESELDETVQLHKYALDPMNQVLRAAGSQAAWRVSGGAILYPPAPGTPVVDYAREASSAPGAKGPAQIPDFGLMLRSETADGQIATYIVPGAVWTGAVIAKACDGASDFNIVRAYNSSPDAPAQYIFGQLYGYMCMTGTNVGILTSYEYMFVVLREGDVLKVSWGEMVGAVNYLFLLLAVPL